MLRLTSVYGVEVRQPRSAWRRSASEEPVVGGSSPSAAGPNRERTCFHWRLLPLETLVCEECRMVEFGAP
jgi:hypothetical protein